MLSMICCDGDGTLGRGATLQEVEQAYAQSGNLIWLDLESPSEEELSFIQSRFGLHPLAIEDCREPGGRAKLEEYDGNLFVVVYARGQQEGDQEPEPVELDLFLGERFLISVHQAPCPAVQSSHHRLEHNLATLKRGPDSALHAVLDQVVDDYLSHLDEIGDRVVAINEELFRHPETDLLQDTFTCSREVLHLQRLVRPQREVVAALSERGRPFIADHTRDYFRDVYDHVLIANDQLETHLQLLMAARESYLSIINNRLSEVMKVLTVVATMILPLTLISGIFGMNLLFPLGLRETLRGFYIVIGGMVVLAVWMWIWFRRHKWL